MSTATMQSTTNTLHKQATSRSNGGGNGGASSGQTQHQHPHQHRHQPFSPTPSIEYNFLEVDDDDGDIDVDVGEHKLESRTVPMNGNESHNNTVNKSNTTTASAHHNESINHNTIIRSEDTPELNLGQSRVHFNTATLESSMVDSFRLFSSSTATTNKKTHSSYGHIDDDQQHHNDEDGDGDDDSSEPLYYKTNFVDLDDEQFEIHQRTNGAAASGNNSRKISKGKRLPIQLLEDEEELELMSMQMLDPPEDYIDEQLSNNGNITQQHPRHHNPHHYRQPPPPQQQQLQHYKNYMVDYDADYEQYYDQELNKLPHPTSNGKFRLVTRGVTEDGTAYMVEEEEGKMFDNGELDDEDIDPSFYENDYHHYHHHHHQGQSADYQGVPEVGNDLVADAKTYGLMMHPYQQYKLQQQQHQQQPPLLPLGAQSSHTVDGYYGYPFNYNLHTIIEESENESSSLQTLSSLTSSTLQSIIYEPGDSNTSTPTNRPQSQTPGDSGTSYTHHHVDKDEPFGELSDQCSVEDQVSSNDHSPLLLAPANKLQNHKFPFTSVDMQSVITNDPTHQLVQSSSKSNPHQPLRENAYSEISFTSSSTSFSEHDEEFEDDPLLDGAASNHSGSFSGDFDEATSSKLERYFTSSLLESSPASTSPRPTSPRVTNTIVSELQYEQPINHQMKAKAINQTYQHGVGEHESNEFHVSPLSFGLESSLSNVVGRSLHLCSSPPSLSSISSRPFVVTTTEKSKDNISRKKCVIVTKQSSHKELYARMLQSIWLNPTYRPWSLSQLHRLNQLFHFDWIHILKNIVSQSKSDAIATKVLTLLIYPQKPTKQNKTSIRLSHLLPHLTDHYAATSGIHLIRNHRLTTMPIKIQQSMLSQSSKVTNSTMTNKTEFAVNTKEKLSTSNEESKAHAQTIKIIINGQSVQFASTGDQKATTYCSIEPMPTPKRPFKTTVKIDACQSATSIKPEIDVEYNNDDTNSFRLNRHTPTIDKLCHREVNPLNRNFIVKQNFTHDTKSVDDASSKPPPAPLRLNKSGSHGTTTSNQTQLSSFRSRPHDTIVGKQSSVKLKQTDNKQQSDPKGINSKFKTISNIGHRSFSPLSRQPPSQGVNNLNEQSQSTQHQSEFGSTKILDRLGKGSKSFRDTRTSFSASMYENVNNSKGILPIPHTWDVLYGGSIRLLRNLPQMMSRFGGSGSKHHQSDEKEQHLKNDFPHHQHQSQSKSLSESNLHKRNKFKRRDESSRDSKENFDTATAFGTAGDSEMNFASSRSPSQLKFTRQSAEVLLTETNKYSSPYLADNDDDVGRNTTAQVSTTKSTPSLLFRLSNIEPMPSSSSNVVECCSGSVSSDNIITATTTASAAGSSTAMYRSAKYQDTNGEWQYIGAGAGGGGTRENGTDNTKPPTHSMATPYGEVQLRSSQSTTHRSSQRQLSLSKESIEMDSKCLTPSSGSPSSGMFQLPEQATGVTIGEVQLSVNYDIRLGTLKIFIKDCRLLNISKTDLYAKVYTLPDRKTKRKTKVVRAVKYDPSTMISSSTDAIDENSALGRLNNNNNNSSTAPRMMASFHETLCFTGPFGEFTSRRLWLSIWNNDKFGRNGPLAETILGPLEASLLSTGQYTQCLWYRLFDPTSHYNTNNLDKTGQQCDEKLLSNQTQNISPHLHLQTNGQPMGFIFLAIKYQKDVNYGQYGGNVNTEFVSGSLHVLIKEAQSLSRITSSFHPTTLGSTYCKVSLLPKRPKLDKIKSKCIKGAIEQASNPRFDFESIFHNLTTTELYNRTLEITLWYQVDHIVNGTPLLPVAKNNKRFAIGGVRFSTNNNESTTKEINLWNQMLDRHNMWAYGEIAIREIC